MLSPNNNFEYGKEDCIMKNRISVFIVILSLIASFMPHFATSPVADLTVQRVSFSKIRIENNETFDMTLSLKNNSASAIKDLYFGIEASSLFKLENNVSKVKVLFEKIEGQDNTTLLPNQERKLTISLRNDGASNSALNFTWHYAGKEISDYVSVPLAEKTDVKPPDNNAVPKLSVRRTNGMRPLSPGDRFAIDLELSNIGLDVAWDVEVHVVPTGEIFLADYDTHDGVSKIRAGRSENLSLDFELDRICKPGSYTVNFSISYRDDKKNLYTESYSSTISVKEHSENASIVLEGIDFSGSALRTTTPNLVFINLKNTGNAAAKSLKVRMEGLSSEGISLKDDVGYKEIPALSSGEKISLPFSLYPAKETAGTVKELTLKIGYQDEFDKEKSVDIPLFFNIEEKPLAEKIIKFEQLKLPTSINVDMDFSIKATVKNTSSETLKNLIVKFDDPNQAVIYKTAPEIYIPSLGPGASKEVSVSLRGKKSMESNHYPLYLRLSAQDGSIKGENTFAYVGVYLNNPEKTPGNAGAKSMPKIIIKDYDFGGETAVAGEEFELKLKIQNTHNAEFVQNVKMSFTSDESTFSPVDMANSIFIERINAKEIKDVVIKLKSKKNAEVKGYNLVFKFQYEDAKGNAYDVNNQPISSEETINIPIYQPFKINTSEIVLPGEVYVGANCEVSFDFYNLGRSTMYNLMVKMEVEDAQVSNSNYYVGNFEAGRQDSFMGGFTPSKTGPVKGKIIFSFEDSQGKELREEKEFSGEVMEMSMPDNGGMPGPNDPGNMPLPEEKKGLSLVAKIAIGIGAFVLVAIIAILLVRRKRKKRQAELTELEE